MPLVRLIHVLRAQGGQMQITAHELRIMIADDHCIVRRGLKELLASRPGWLVCAEASTGREAVALAEEYKPDILIMDIGLPELNGIDAARIIRKTFPQTEVLVFSMHCSEQVLQEIKEAGVRGYISKLDPNRDLMLAVEALAKHRPYFTSRSAELLSHDPLTAREREVIQLIVEGKRTKQVAAMLGISVKTADTHRANLMRKLDVHSVSGLMHYAVRNQMIRP
jgi:DNA-binding NarL/FixJ family response regulator